MLLLSEHASCQCIDQQDLHEHKAFELRKAIQLKTGIALILFDFSYSSSQLL